MASLQCHAAILLGIGLLAGCGGDRSRARTGTDTSGAAAPDSSAAAPATTPAPGAADTAPAAAPSAGDTAGKSGAAPPAAPKPPPADTGTTHAARKTPVAKPKAAAPAVAAPSARASQDTSGARSAESTRTAAAAAPAPTPQQQDTSKAAAAAGQEQPLRDAYHQPPKDTVDQAVYDGWKQFNLNCARCHGEDALGTSFAPHLILSLKPDGPINTKELFVQTVCAGRPTKGMPAWCALGLGLDKINDIYLYVKGRSDAKISPGRPAVKQQG